MRWQYNRQYPSTCDGTECDNFINRVLYGCKTAAEVFNRLTEHNLLTPFQYSIIEALVNKFLPDDGEFAKQIQQYEVDLGGYISERKIEEYLSCHGLPDPDLFCKLIGKIHTDESSLHSLQFIINLWKKLSTILNFAPTIYKMAKGCVCITWIFPAFLIPHVVREIAKSHPFFKENEFLWVKLNSCQVYPTIDPEVRPTIPYVPILKEYHLVTFSFLVISSLRKAFVKH